MDTDTKHIKVLLIEDNPGDIRLTHEMLLEESRFSFELIQASVLSKGVEHLKDNSIDIVLLDLGLPDSQGIDTLHVILSMAPRIPIIVLTGLSDEELAINAVKAGAQDYVIKGQINSPLLCRSILYAIERKIAEDALKQSEIQYRLLADNMKDQIWLLDMNLKPTYVSPSVERSLGYTFEEIIKLPMKKFLTATSFQLAMDFLNIEMPKASADQFYVLKNSLELEFCTKYSSTLWLEFQFSLIWDNDQPLSILCTGRDITERQQAEERTRKALRATVEAFTTTVETRDPYTAGHQRRVADLARTIAEELNLPTNIVDGIRMAASIHDLGKISVPAEILIKPSKLSDIEFSLIKIHSKSGYDILKDIDFPWPVARIVLEHHERINGSGYPNGLVSEDTLLESRIIAVADVVESMASHRPYRPALGIAAALEEIEKNRNILYDNDVVDTCLKLFKEKKYHLISA